MHVSPTERVGVACCRFLRQSRQEALALASVLSGLIHGAIASNCVTHLCLQELLKFISMQVRVVSQELPLVNLISWYGLFTLASEGRLFCIVPPSKSILKLER